MDPSRRFLTIVLGLGTVVLLLAILIGERMGDSVFTSAMMHGAGLTSITITPAPTQSSPPYGPSWKESQSLAAPPDPHFPDPRVPPVALPTPPPAARPEAKATPTPNLNLPVWRRQQPLPVIAPVATPPGGTVELTPAPEPTKSPAT